MNKTLTFSLTALLLITCSVPAFSQEKDQKVAIIDLSRILNESKVGQDMREELEARETEKIKESKMLEVDLAALQEKLQNESYGYSEEKKKELQQNFQNKYNEFREFNQSAQQEIMEMRSAMLKKLEDIVYPIIDDIAENDDIDFIFSKLESGLIYANPDVDITGRVLAKMVENEKKETAEKKSE